MVSPERLRRFPQLARASEAVLKQVAMHAGNADFEAGEYLFLEGNHSTHLMFLEKGEIDIIYRLGDDREVTVDTITAGDIFSWSSLLEPHTMSATAKSRSDGRLIQVEAEPLLKLCEAHPEFGYRLMAEIAKVLRSRLNASRVQLAALN